MESNFEFCLIGKHSDTGRVRKANEDSMDVFDAANMKVFVVCDGMGGHVGGQVASQTAIAAIKQFMLNHVFTDPREAINNAIIAANDAIIQKTQAQPELNGMGSTCVMLIVTSDGKVYYGHIGDSRIYIVANHQIRQLTKDHSYVQTLVDAGEISKDQAESHPRKNEITNALGLPDMQPPTLCNEPIEPEAGNCFVLCSDGLSGMVDDQHIERLVSKHDINIQQRANKLVQMANEAGGKDNITVELVEFAVSSGHGKTQKKGVNKKLFLAIGVAVIAILAIGFIVYLKPFGKQNTPANEPTQALQTDIADKDDAIEISYIKGEAESIISDTVSENEKIFSCGVIGGNQYIKTIGTDGKNIIIRWNDEAFLEPDLTEAVITVTLTTTEKKEYTRRIKVKIVNDHPAATPPDDPKPTEGEALQPTGGLKSGQ
ncbi:hypothetical protein FACS1894140_1900 [Spirochaetia bacterium]|nr:hypothetical protein FACS1894140_1900 [Spirochaetia bacterium]